MADARTARRRLRAGLGLIAAGLFTAWTGARNTEVPEDFPREASQFLPPDKLEAEAARLDAAVKEDPEDLKSLVALGILRFEQGKDHYVEGINALEAAHGLGSTDVRIFYYLGTMYQELGLFPFAAGQYQRFLRNRPGDREVRQRSAKLEYLEGRYAEAAKEFQALAADAPADLTIRENLALSLAGAGRDAEARPMLETLSLEGGETGRRAHFFLGRLASANKEFRSAVGHLEKAAADGSPCPGVDAKELARLLAEGYDRLGLTEQARPAWEKALALDPSSKEAKSRLRQLNRRAPVARRRRRRPTRSEARLRRPTDG